MIRRLLKCVREYKWAAILSPVCMAGEVAMEMLIPLVMANLYDYGIKLQNSAYVLEKSLLLILCALCSLAFGVGSAIFASKAATTSTNSPPLPLSRGLPRIRRICR